MGRQPADFDQSFLAWRTALHFDPSAEAPLRSLMGLYEKSAKMSELIALYTAHLSQFPQDENAKVVLARLYVETGDDQAESWLLRILDVKSWSRHVCLP